MRVVTHSGPFHADEVFAYALLRVFLGAQVELQRTRDAALIARADIAIDVGGEYDPARGRFDHHQRTYQGPLSSAGMVLNWLEHAGKLPARLAAQLRADWVDYIDAVDCGRRSPGGGLPCISLIVATLAEQAHSPADFDARFLDAAAMCEGVLRGLCAMEHRSQEASSAVTAAMRSAEAAGSRVLVFDRHYKWKRAYFEHGGAHHASDYVLFPDEDGGWRLLGIPDEAGGFGLKRPLPAEWAGLVDDELSSVVGVVRSSVTRIAFSPCSRVKQQRTPPFASGTSTGPRPSPNFAVRYGELATLTGFGRRPAPYSCPELSSWYKRCSSARA